eukprot:scaffold66961_cov54-Phaeocystis_antarctica.AAC.3
MPRMSLACVAVMPPALRSASPPPFSLRSNPAISICAEVYPASFAWLAVRVRVRVRARVRVGVRVRG